MVNDHFSPIPDNQGLGTGVGRGLGVGVTLGARVGVAVELGVDVGEGVSIGVTTAVAVGVPVGVGDPDGVYVMASTGGLVLSRVSNRLAVRKSNSSPSISQPKLLAGLSNHP